MSFNDSGVYPKSFLKITKHWLILFNPVKKSYYFFLFFSLIKTFTNLVKTVKENLSTVSYSKIFSILLFVIQLNILQPVCTAKWVWLWTLKTLLYSYKNFYPKITWFSSALSNKEFDTIIVWTFLTQFPNKIYLYLSEIWFLDSLRIIFNRLKLSSSSHFSISLFLNSFCTYFLYYKILLLISIFSDFFSKFFKIFFIIINKTPRVVSFHLNVYFIFL